MNEHWLDFFDYGTLLFHVVILFTALVWLSIQLVKKIKLVRIERKRQKFHVITGGKMKRIS